MQTKVINWNCANKSCLSQVVHTKAIAALTQLCDFFASTSKFYYKSRTSFQIFSPNFLLCWGWVVVEVGLGCDNYTQVAKEGKKAQNCVKAAIAFVCTTYKKQLLYTLLQLITFVCTSAIDNILCSTVMVNFCMH